MARRRKPTARPGEVSREWREVLVAIPGYDPFRDAEGCYFDPAAAELAIRFFPDCLSHVKGEWAGKPIVLEPWQRSVVANAWGWKRTADGFRRYRYVFLLVPRKNGKSTIVAGLALLLLVSDGEPGAEIYSAAGDKDQAAIIWQMAASMVAANPELRARVRPYRAGKSLEYRAGNSYYRAISSEGATKHGYNAHGIVVDELHVQPDGDLVDALETSVGARRQPMTVYVSTSDYERQSICNEKYDYAAKVRDGTFRDPRWLPCIWEATRSDDWRDPKTWAKANPNLGRSVSLEYVQDECRQAQRVPRKLNVFLRLQLNLRTQAESAWLPKEEWAACAGSRSYAELVEHLKGKRAIGGLDCSAVKDLTAFVLYFPEERACLTWAWVPQGTLELRGAREGDPYAAWASEGYLEVLPGKAMDLEKVRRRIGEICEPYRVQEINFDRWGAVQIATQLRDDGFDVVKFGQGFASMSEPSKHLERLVLDRALVHGGHPVLTYCALNAMVVTDPADNIKPVKNPSQAGEHGRIDALVALVMGIGGAIVKSESDDGRSVYDSRGIERL